MRLAWLLAGESKRNKQTHVHTSLKVEIDVYHGYNMVRHSTHSYSLDRGHSGWIPNAISPVLPLLKHRSNNLFIYPRKTRRIRESPTAVHLYIIIIGSQSHPNRFINRPLKPERLFPPYRYAQNLKSKMGNISDGKHRLRENHETLRIILTL